MDRREEGEKQYRDDHFFLELCDVCLNACVKKSPKPYLMTIVEWVYPTPTGYRVRVAGPEQTALQTPVIEIE